MSKFFLLLLILSISSLSYEQTLRETTYCEVSNSQIQNKARGLKKSSTLETAKHIFSFVQVDIKYESYSNTKKGAVRTLNERKGNCADQAHLLVALFRAAGIPARYVHGTNHYWTQCQVDGKLYDCDPTNRKHSFGHRNPDGKQVLGYMDDLNY